MRTIILFCFAVVGMTSLIQNGWAEETATAPPQSLKKLEFRTGYEFRNPSGRADQKSQYTAMAGTKQLMLTNPNYPVNATEWEGNLTVTDTVTKQRCTTQKDRFVLEVYAPDNGKMAVVLSHDAQARVFDFVDLQTCQYRYPQIMTDSEQVQINYNQIAIFPWCYCPPRDKNKICECHAAQVYTFGPEYQPVPAETASQQLTQRELGVSFSGTRNVQHPGTKDAKLVNQKLLE